MQADLKSLEFDGIRRLLEKLCATPFGAEAARNIEPAPNLAIARQMQAAVTAARQGLDAGDGPHMPELPDVRAALRQASSPGAALPGTALLNLRQVITAGQALRPFVEKRPALYPGAVEHLSGADGLLARFEAAILPSGRVREDASPALVALHNELKQLRSDVQAQLKSRMRQPDIAGGIPDSDKIHWHGQRAVLALPGELADKLKGVRRGMGPGGRDYLVEPMEVLALNNRLETVGGKLDAENQIVLRELTDQIRAQLPALNQLMDALTWLDLALAAGQLSLHLNATPPELVDAPIVELQGAYHPQLLLAFANRHGPMPRPLDIRIDDARPVLVITGPNTGGKTVVLKTVGLLTAMAHSGLHLPTEGASRIGNFSRIIVDVGDHQSIAHHLSTFAGHVEVLKRLLAESDERTLVLLDELGTGTDPEEGAALAMAVLDELAARGVHGIVTTHLSPLKTFAAQHPRLENASMRFDYERLEPTYQLEVGTPGRSLGLIVARQRGLAATLVERAHQYLTQIAPGHES
ncbi:MAG: endonuclease MutS2 [Pseudomonadota bacterium]|uniref:endonuclease MutS2 n=1 Tax=Thermithiobacillus tepidarius TaxID=929 RepID=UPI0003F4DA62|nr:DNA mismatch repair protein MutS [Thermithiobacillus tepidarius]